MMDGDDALIFH